MRVPDEPVLRADVAREVLIFRLAEDPVQIIVAESVAEVLRKFDDVDLCEMRSSSVRTA